MKLTEVVVKKGKEKTVKVTPGFKVILSSSGVSKFILIDNKKNRVGVIFNKPYTSIQVQLAWNVTSVICKNLDCGDQNLYITETSI